MVKLSRRGICFAFVAFPNITHDPRLVERSVTRADAQNDLIGEGQNNSGFFAEASGRAFATEVAADTYENRSGGGRREG